MCFPSKSTCKQIVKVRYEGGLNSRLIFNEDASFLRLLFSNKQACEMAVIPRMSLIVIPEIFSRESPYEKPLDPRQRLSGMTTEVGHDNWRSICEGASNQDRMRSRLEGESSSKNRKFAPANSVVFS